MQQADFDRLLIHHVDSKLFSPKNMDEEAVVIQAKERVMARREEITPVSTQGQSTSCLIASISALITDLQLKFLPLFSNDFTIAHSVRPVRESSN